MEKITEKTSTDQPPAKLMPVTQPEAGAINPFASAASYEVALRMAAGIADSAFIPGHYRGKPENVLVAMDLANNIKNEQGQPMVSFMTLLRNTYVVSGKPGFESAFIIGLINSCGRFKTRLNYEMTGSSSNDTWGCVAWVDEKGTDRNLRGSEVTMALAKAEGWYSKAGSKWKTMPEQMLKYRAATFFARLHCPEYLLGMRPVEELKDIGETEVVQPESLAQMLDKSSSDSDKPLQETLTQDPGADASPGAPEAVQEAPAVVDEAPGVVDGAYLEAEMKKVNRFKGSKSVQKWWEQQQDRYAESAPNGATVKAIGDYVRASFKNWQDQEREQIKK